MPYRQGCYSRIFSLPLISGMRDGWRLSIATICISKTNRVC